MLKVITERAWNVLVERASKSIARMDVTDDARKDACPLYHVMFHPLVCYDVYDQFGRVAIAQMPFVDRVLQTMFDICSKRVGRDLAKDPLISRVFSLCSDASASVNVRTKQLFVVLLLCLDQSCLEFFKTLFPNQKGQELVRFNKQFPRIQVEVHGVLNSTLGPFQALKAREYILDDIVIPACF